MTSDGLADLRDVRVLVAEDEQSLREFLDVALGLTGAMVTVTSTFPEALAALDRVQPHVVLFNVGLRGHGAAMVHVVDYLAVASAVDEAIKAA